MANRLADAKSPYLLQHKDNPVEWFPWGQDAFAQARRRDVPVMVSIGYSTCHWCHVMARESFQDAATAAELDAGFVAIKVDREEHPEVDAAYMAAAAAFTQNLGWPLTVFATPEGRPFFAGTYFPPEPRVGPSRVPAGARRGERGMDRAPRADRRHRGCRRLGARRGRARAPRRARRRPPTADELADAAACPRRTRGSASSADSAAGPRAPKFPVATALRFLQARARPRRRARGIRRRRPRARGDGRLAAPRPRRGRLLPLRHTPRLVGAALRAHAHRQRPAAGCRARRRSRRHRARRRRLPARRAAAARRRASAPHRTRSRGSTAPAARAATTNGMPRPAADLEPPAVDGKVVTGWNGLAIGALARAGCRLGRPGAASRRRAGRRTRCSSVNVAPDGRLVRASLDEIASRASATLADYGQLAAGLAALAIATGEPAYAMRARELVDACVAGRRTCVARARRRRPGARRTGRRGSGCRLRRGRAVGPRRARRGRVGAVDARRR